MNTWDRGKVNFNFRIMNNGSERHRGNERGMAAEARNEDYDVYRMKW